MAQRNGRISCALLAFSLLTFAQLEDNVYSAEIPLALLRQMLSQRSAKDFINNMIVAKPRPTVVPQGGAGGRIGGQAGEGDILFTHEGALDPTKVEVVAGQMAEPAHCEPSMKAVPFPRGNSANSVFWPTCVNVQRCGGCCGSDILSCVPTSVKMATFFVMNATLPYPGADKFEMQGMASFQLEQHLACECRCTVQEHHCHPTKHEYLADSCRCQCKNTRASTQCSLRKKWDERHCACVCEKQYQCYASEYFDSHTCSCQQRRGRMRSSVTRSSNPCSGISCGPNKESVISGSQCLCRSDPCKEINCRPQFEPVRVGSKCECRYAQSAGSDIRPGYFDVFGFGTRTDTEDETAVAPGGINIGNLGGDDDLAFHEEPTTTTARPRTRSGRRHRPSGGQTDEIPSMVDL